LTTSLGGKEMLPKDQSKPLLMPLRHIPTHLVAGSQQGEEISTSLSMSPPQEAVGSNEVAS